MALGRTPSKKTKPISPVNVEDLCLKRDKGEQSPIPGSPWEVSTVMEKDIMSLVVRQFLALKELWGTDAPSDRTSPLPTLARLWFSSASSIYHGLGVPVHWFVQDLHYYYDVKAHDLTPNGIVLLAMFISFYEDFVGIEPHKAL